MFNWPLLVLDLAIGFFFLLLMLVMAGLLFDGFHEAFGAPDFLARLGQAHVVGTTISLATVWVPVVWGTVTVRVLFVTRWFWQAGQHAHSRISNSNNPNRWRMRGLTLILGFIHLWTTAFCFWPA